MHIPVFTLESEITPDQRSFFDTHGFIRFGKVASDDEVDRLVEALDGLQSRFVAEERKQVMGVPRRFGAQDDGSPFIQRFAFTSHYSSAIHDFVTDRRFEAVRQFIGTYCINCHGPEKSKGDRTFHQLANLQDGKWMVNLGNEKKVELLRDILDQLNLGEMPPRKKGVKQPPFSEVKPSIREVRPSICEAWPGHR